MILEDLLKTVHYHYVMGYIADGQFWCVHETSSLDKAKEMMHNHKSIFQQNKQDYLIIKKIISYEQLKD